MEESPIKSAISKNMKLDTAISLAESKLREVQGKSEQMQEGLLHVVEKLSEEISRFDSIKQNIEFMNEKVQKSSESLEAQILIGANIINQFEILDKKIFERTENISEKLLGAVANAQAAAQDLELKTQKIEEARLRGATSAQSAEARFMALIEKSASGQIDFAKNLADQIKHFEEIEAHIKAVMDKSFSKTEVFYEEFSSKLATRIKDAKDAKELLENALEVQSKVLVQAPSVLEKIRLIQEEVIKSQIEFEEKIDSRGNDFIERFLKVLSPTGEFEVFNTHIKQILEENITKSENLKNVLGDIEQKGLSTKEVLQSVCEIVEDTKSQANAAFDYNLEKATNTSVEMVKAFTDGIQTVNGKISEINDKDLVSGSSISKYADYIESKFDDIMPKIEQIKQSYSLLKENVAESMNVISEKNGQTLGEITNLKENMNSLKDTASDITSLVVADGTSIKDMFGNIEQTKRDCEIIVSSITATKSDVLNILETLNSVELSNKSLDLIKSNVEDIRSIPEQIERISRELSNAGHVARGVLGNVGDLQDGLTTLEKIERNTEHLKALLSENIGQSLNANDMDVTQLNNITDRLVSDIKDKLVVVDQSIDTNFINDASQVILRLEKIGLTLASTIMPEENKQGVISKLFSKNDTSVRFKIHNLLSDPSFLEEANMFCAGIDAFMKEVKEKDKNGALTILLQGSELVKLAEVIRP